MTMNVALTRVAAGLLGCALVVGGAGAALADENRTQQRDAEGQTAPVGALTLSVASTATTLTEVPSSDANVRQFTGSLPEVTVTDDRAIIPSGAVWYVTGQASSLTSGSRSIDAGHLGWAPKVITTSGHGEVASGDIVNTVLDAATADTPLNDGLASAHLLALSVDSRASAAVGSWTAGADLFLRVPRTVEPGAYSGTITLTLWEEAQPQ